MVVQTTANLTFYSDTSFLHMFARIYSSAKEIGYVLFELIKRFPLLFPDPYKRSFFKSLLFRYTSIYVVCSVYSTLYLQWITNKTIAMSGDVEINPGPHHSTFSFCSWNLNSICVHNFARVSLIKAYNSIYNYDLIGIVETHIDSTVNLKKLDLNGYTFIKRNHPLNIKRGGVGLYLKDSLPAISREDLAILPECIVCEIQLDKKKYFFSIHSHFRLL